MKKLFILFLMSFLVISAFGQEEFPGLKPEKQQENFAFISSMKGEVSLKEERAQQNQYVFGDDWIVTGKGARAEVRFGENGGFLSIDENSKVFFVEVSSTKSVVAFYQGAVYLRNLEGVELRAAGKPGKIVIPQKDKVIRIDIAKDKVDVDESPNFRDEFDALNQTQEKVQAQNSESVERHNTVVYTDYYLDCWRWYGLCLSPWYPGWTTWYYPMYYGYYYGSGYYAGGLNYNYGNSGRQAVNRNQLQSRQINARPSRMNSSNSNAVNSSAKTTVRPTRTATNNRQATNYPSRISTNASRPTRQSSNNSFGSLRPSSSSPRIQSTPRGSFRAPQSSSGSRVAAAPRASSVSRGSSSSTNRSSGSVSRSTSSGSSGSARRK